MKFTTQIRSRFVNYLDAIMISKKVSNTALSQASGISEPTISRIRKNPYYNWNAATLIRLANALNVSMKDLFAEQRVFNPQPVANGFSAENLKILNQCLRTHGSQLKYQVYSEQCKMNVRSKYWRNWRVSFTGNWQFYDGADAKLVLIDFDAQHNRENATSMEVERLFDRIVASLIDYATKQKINRIIYPLPYPSVILREQEDTECLTQVMLKQGFTQEMYLKKPMLTWHLPVRKINQQVASQRKHLTTNLKM